MRKYSVARAIPAKRGKRMMSLLVRPSISCVGSSASSSLSVSSSSPSRRVFFFPFLVGFAAVEGRVRDAWDAA